MTVSPSYKDVLALAGSRIGCLYEYGADVPLNNPAFRGPFDCAEFASWVAMQITGELIGARPAANPDPYTGTWYDQGTTAPALTAGTTGPIPAASTLRRALVNDAARIPGSFLVRRPQADADGHVVIVGMGGTTIEAYSSQPPPQGGVRAFVVGSRRWDLGVLLPHVSYERMAPVTVAPPTILRRGSKGEQVKTLQRLLGFKGDDVDGSFGKQTLAAVVAFQRANGLVADGEVGPLTWAKLAAKTS